MTYKINRVQGQSFPGRGEKPSKTKLNKSLSFQNYLYKEIKKKDIKISAHARERLKERQLDFQAKDMDRIKEAISNLEEKGAKESLILYRDMAFIASVKNRTIITAMGQDDMDIITNIDSALIIK